MVLVVVMAAARRAFRVENHLRINNHNNLFYGRCTAVASLLFFVIHQQSFCQFIVVWSLTMEMGKGLIVAMVTILAHLQLQLVW